MTLATGELICVVEAASGGGFNAHALREDIFTEVETLDDLDVQVRDTVRCHFDGGQAPGVARLQFVRNRVDGTV